MKLQLYFLLFCFACHQVTTTSLPAFRRLQHDALQPLLLPEHVVLGEKLSVSLVVLLSRSSPDKTVPHSPASAAANVFFPHPLPG